MCFTQPVSLLLSIFGSLAAIQLYNDERPFFTYLHFVFYSGMEFLQFLQYFYTDNCSDTNVLLTKIAYIYIWLQPILYNTFYLLTNNRNVQIFKYNIMFSIFTFLYACDRMFTKVLHTEGIRNNEIMVGPTTCTFQGKKHLYWNFELASNNGVEANYFLYLALICFPTFWMDNFLYGLFLSFTFIMGLIIAYCYTENIHETPAFWCILSVPFLLVSYLSNTVVGIKISRIIQSRPIFSTRTNHFRRIKD